MTNEQRRKARAERQQRRTEHKSQNYRVLDTSKVSDIEWIKPELGKEYFWDIMPYVVSSPNHPEYETLKKDGLLEDYSLNLWVHRKVGPTEQQVVCPKKTYGKRCPICEEHDRIRNDEEHKDLDWKDQALQDDIKHLRATQRSFFTIIDLNDENKMKFFEYSYYWFTNNLDEQVKRKSKRKQIFLEDFTEDGVSIAFEFGKSTFDDKQVGEVKSFDFEDREEGYTEEEFEDAPRLDTMVKTHTYEELYSIFTGEELDSSSDDDEEEEVVETKRSRRRREPEPEVEETVDEEPEVEERPRRRRNRDSKPTTPTCPESEGEFGVTIDELDACESCDLYDDCDKKYSELQED